MGIIGYRPPIDLGAIRVLCPESSGSGHSRAERQALYIRAILLTLLEISSISCLLLSISSQMLG